jgi:hypothetical protein
VKRWLRRLAVPVRFLGSVLIVAPVLYRAFIAEGDVYHFLALVVTAPLAAGVLVVHTVLGQLFDWGRESLWLGLLFIAVATIGVLQAWYFLPQFRM